MRSSIKRSLTGLLIAGALVFSAVGANAIPPSPDEFIGIVGHNPPGDGDQGGYGYQGGGYQANTGHQFGHTHRNRQGGYGGGYYRGY